MARKSTTNRALEEHAFPIRAIFENPWIEGLRWGGVDDWLQANAGPGNYAMHGYQGQTMAIYLRVAQPLVGLVEAFPALRLADETEHLIHLKSLREGRKAEHHTTTGCGGNIV